MEYQSQSNILTEVHRDTIDRYVWIKRHVGLAASVAHYEFERDMTELNRQKQASDDALLRDCNAEIPPLERHVKGLKCNMQTPNLVTATRELAQSASPEAAEECSICKEAFTSRAVLNCGHCFDFLCIAANIQEGMNMADNCPMCRARITTIQRRDIGKCSSTIIHI